MECTSSSWLPLTYLIRTWQGQDTSNKIAGLPRLHKTTVYSLWAKTFLYTWRIRKQLSRLSSLYCRLHFNQQIQRPWCIFYSSLRKAPQHPQNTNCIQYVSYNNNNSYYRGLLCWWDIKHCCHIKLPPNEILMMSTNLELWPQLVNLQLKISLATLHATQ